MDVPSFNYTSPGELYYPKGSSFQKRVGMIYRRFATAAEALRFAIEGIPALALQGCYMEVEGERYHPEQMRQLYENERYPLSHGISGTTEPHTRAESDNSGKIG